MTTDADTKRFATIVLTLVMEAMASGANVPKIMVIFRGEFCDGDNYSTAERAQWDPDVVYVFKRRLGLTAK